MPRKGLFSITIDEVSKGVLETLSKRYRLSQKMIIEYLIELCDKHNLMSGDWKARLEDLDLARERVTRLEGSCPALIKADNAFWCIWGVDGKPPAKKKLAKDYGDALEICRACKKTLQIKLENESYQVKVRELEEKLETQASEKFKVPVCTYGASLAADGVSMTGCRLNPGKLVSIEEYCKKRMNGKPCNSYVERVIGVGKKI